MTFKSSLMRGHFSEPKCISVSRSFLESWLLVGTSTTLRLGVEQRRQALCGGRGDPLFWWRSSLVEPGAKVTVSVHGRDLVAEKQYSL